MRSFPVVTGTAELIEDGDIDALVAHVVSCALDDRWADVVDLRDRCLGAAVRGKQLWPAAAYAEYRMALDGPAALSASVLDSNLSRFALGPFTEVAAQEHRWADLTTHFGAVSMPAQAAFAQERVIRGEDLREDDTALLSRAVYELPLVTLSWEPAYPTAEYGPDSARFPLSPPPVSGRAQSSARGRIVSDPDVLDALRELAMAWANGSNGRVEAAAVEGDAAAAVASFGLSATRLTPIKPASALAAMAWAAANGGAHGRRSGMAAGRSRAWWAAAQLSGVDLDPLDGDELGAAIDELAWFAWDDGAPATGWALRLAVQDSAAGLAWAIAAIDAT